MRPAHQPPFGGAYSRRFTAYAGIFFDEFATDSAWIRETATVRLPRLDDIRELVVRGEIRPHPAARGRETTAPSLAAFVNGRFAGALADLRPGPWELRVALPRAEHNTLTLRLGGVGSTNFLAWLGRVTGLGPLQRFRAQNKNRQLRLRTIESAAGEAIFDFSQRDAPYSSAFARRHARLGLNIVGFLTAELGVGESARCMVRAADAATLPTALVPLKLHCKNRLGDQTFAARLQDENPHAVNVVHLDPPASRDLDHHHGKNFRAGKYNIAYFAWELPEFPDAWVPSFDYYDEVWCPSEFTTAALALKSPVPVLTMPHAIALPRPAETLTPRRARFALPVDAFLFLTLFDLNSYSARKNPRGAIEAFRQSGLAGRGAALVVKVQNVAGNEADFSALQASVRDLPGTVLLTDTLPRADITALEAACDCFVSLHRSEGFGLAIAEAMFLGKPVISTDWSAPAEFVDADNGCPVRARLVTLEQNHGPYAKGATWAEPDTAHAAEHMRRLFGDRALAARLGAVARATIETRFSPAAIGARYRRRLECIAAF
ncbi:MAG TPA: glycosyltransferase family 4 protein [Opitutaceae bacterium]|nr:glycosyltransferase family 4 protein [Opitutaceae bacterium]